MVEKTLEELAAIKDKTMKDSLAIFRAVINKKKYQVDAWMFVNFAITGGSFTLPEKRQIFEMIKEEYPKLYIKVDEDFFGKSEERTLLDAINLVTDAQYILDTTKVMFSMTQLNGVSALSTQVKNRFQNYLDYICVDIGKFQSHYKHQVQVKSFLLYLATPKSIDVSETVETLYTEISVSIHQSPNWKRPEYLHQFVYWRDIHKHEVSFDYFCDNFQLIGATGKYIKV